MNAVEGGVFLEAPAERGAALAALREAGAERFDPVRFHYLDALARRAARQGGGVRRMLDERLAAALADFEQAFARARDAARATVAHVAPLHPRAADELAALCAAGDFGAVERLAAGLEKQERPSLAELARHIEQQLPRDEAPAGARPELKAVRYFRDTWAKLSVDRQLSHAIDQAPENAGPLNSHYLVLRSLEMMRDISPDYLNRFMSYADTLLCLDRAAERNKPAAKKPARARTAKR
jgi:hypothetical protein